MRRILPAFAFAFAAALLAGCATPPSEPVKVRVLAINDFHGNLLPPQGGIRIFDPADPTKRVSVPAGGAARLATAVAALEAQNPNHVFVAAGDLIGASPLLSALFHDEPTIEALGMAGLAISAVGNHEFDEGPAELLRMQNGGCAGADTCRGPKPFAGATFQYLAASTVELRTGRTLFPPYVIKTFQGLPVAFVGLTLKGTPAIVTPAGVAGLRFEDEADTVNRLVPELRAKGVEAIVVLVHEGGVPVGDYNECPGISGPIVDIVKKLDKAVDVVISGHTHRAYNCRIDGRLVTSGDKYGTIVSAIDLVLDPKTRDVTSAKADNVIVRTSEFAEEPKIAALVAQYQKLAGPLLERVVGTLAESLSNRAGDNGESPLGQVIADAQLAATRDAGAQIAFMNPGGIRAALFKSADGQVRYSDLYSTQPFNNQLVTMTLTGSQLLELLEQQWQGQGDEGRVLQVSRGFTFAWGAQRPVGQRVVPGSAMLDGQPIDPSRRYRVTVNAFLSTGGDKFVVLKQGTERITGMLDIEALEQFMKSHPGLAPGTTPRVMRLN